MRWEWTRPAFFLTLLAICASARVGGETLAVPLKQSNLSLETAGRPKALTLRDASQEDRWLGLGVRDIRWAPDGESVYFRWNLRPNPEDDPDSDPWFRVDREGAGATELSRSEWSQVPSGEMSWSAKAERAVWIQQGALYVYDAARPPAERSRAVLRMDQPFQGALVSQDGKAAYVTMSENLYVYLVDEGRLRQLTRKKIREKEKETDLALWLESQQQELFDHHRKEKARRDAASERERSAGEWLPQEIPVEEGTALENIRLTPDARFVTFRARRQAKEQEPTRYIDWVSESGYAEVHTARSKVGEPQEQTELGIVRMDPTVDPDRIDVRWVELPEAQGRSTVVEGPYWSLEGRRAVVQFLSEDHKDLWLAELDVETGGTRVLVHDHDDAWLGGPPIQANSFEPGLLEWLPGDRFAFASERSGWSHLYVVENGGSVRPLTEGPWEVRRASLSRDRSFWLIAASREHPCEDHLYTLPAGGGDLVRLTTAPGRSDGYLSPDGARLAVVYSSSVELPDLFLQDVAPRSVTTRVTMSGTDNFYTHLWLRPEIVSFSHPDGGPLWGALYKPDRADPKRAAVLHIHGGGYRQFSHRGWTVYGYATHLGAIHFLVQNGYTVLDFDYRGSAGFGRDYRTDIYRSMGLKDVDGARAAIDYLKEKHGVEPSRVGLYGISYGGFFTLMALFRHPGLFAAGVANAAVTDWAHYNHAWTRRILNLPYQDEEAYKRSSPIYYAQGLEDPLLIVHGLIDDNVHFQDAARLVQKLIELEKDFEVMVYPVEHHVIATEASRYDYVRRLVAFFDRHLRGR